MEGAVVTIQQLILRRIDLLGFSLDQVIIGSVADMVRQHPAVYIMPKGDGYSADVQFVTNAGTRQLPVSGASRRNARVGWNICAAGRGGRQALAQGVS